MIKDNRHFTPIWKLVVQYRNKPPAMSETDLKPGQNLAHLLPSSWSTEVQRWFAEDTPSFDWAGFVVGEEEQEAILWGKSGVSKPVLFLT